MTEMSEGIEPLRPIERTETEADSSRGLSPA